MGYQNGPQNYVPLVFPHVLKMDIQGALQIPHRGGGKNLWLGEDGASILYPPTPHS